jgi:hypothetical protein
MPRHTRHITKSTGDGVGTDTPRLEPDTLLIFVPLVRLLARAAARDAAASPSMEIPSRSGDQHRELGTSNEKQT